MHRLPLFPLCAVLAVTLSACSALPSATTSTPTVAPASAPTSAIPTPASASVPTAPVPTVDQLAEAAIERVSPAVVKVTNVGIGLGSGVILSRDGYIVTNNHVVSGATAVRVTLSTGKTVPARIVATDSGDDLAVVKISASNLPTAVLGNSSALKVGQTVLAIGNPVGYTHTVTEGIVSALDRTVSEGQQTSGLIRNAVQTSAPINPGNSGGALINLAGQVIGIPTLTAVDPEFNAPANGIGFAIPSNTVSFIAEQAIRTGHITHTGRAALGVQVISVTPDLAAQYSLPVSSGVLIAGMNAGGAAAHAGLKTGDVIVAVNGGRVGSESALVDALAQFRPGDRVTVTVVTKSGTKRTYHVTLGEFPASANG